MNYVSLQNTFCTGKLREMRVEGFNPPQAKVTWFVLFWPLGFMDLGAMVAHFILKKNEKKKHTLLSTSPVGLEPTFPHGTFPAARYTYEVTSRESTEAWPYLPLGSQCAVWDEFD
jgi:hypothetical protein